MLAFDKLQKSRILRNFHFRYNYWPMGNDDQIYQHIDCTDCSVYILECEWLCNQDTNYLLQKFVTFLRILLSHLFSNNQDLCRQQQCKGSHSKWIKPCQCKLVVRYLYLKRALGKLTHKVKRNKFPSTQGKVSKFVAFCSTFWKLFLSLSSHPWCSILLKVIYVVLHLCHLDLFR